MTVPSISRSSFRDRDSTIIKKFQKWSVSWTLRPTLLAAAGPAHPGGDAGEKFSAADERSRRPRRLAQRSFHPNQRIGNGPRHSHAGVDLCCARARRRYARRLRQHDLSRLSALQQLRRPGANHQPGRPRRSRRRWFITPATVRCAKSPTTFANVCSPGWRKPAKPPQIARWDIIRKC